MVFIVAEIGVNWDGDIELAEEMMKKSKENGCDAVKFQAFNEKLIGDHPEKERLMKSSISQTNIEIINNLSKTIGIEWFCTPMFVEAVEFLEPVVKRYKIRFSDGKQIVENKSTELIERLLDTGKQIMISSQKSPKNCKFYDNPNISWLYCVPKYPCELVDFDFSYINDFNGFSNHCPQKLAPIASVLLGAEIVEIHITSDKNKDFVDNPVSFNYDELKNIIENIRNCEKIKH